MTGATMRSGRQNDESAGTTRVQHPSSRKAGSHRAGFTFAEVLIASATGMTIVAAVLSLYLFLSGEGRALRYQVEFTNKARVLQTAFEDLVEANWCLLVDADNLGVSLYPNEAVLSGGSTESENAASWIGYEAGSTIAESKLVYRENGKGIDPARVLCEWVGPADDNEPMFRLVTGVSCALSAHIGDPPVGSTEPDTTGPGRQGMNVTVIGACRNLRREW